MRSTRSLVTLAACAALAVPRAAAAQGAFLGTWTIRAWQVAPWVAAADRAATKPDSALLGRRVVIEHRRVRGPDILACAHPSYEVHDVPPEGLFEGGLTRAAAQAAALGFRSARISTLVPGCEIEFHARDRDTALFALNNVLYTMVRRR